MIRLSKAKMSLLYCMLMGLCCLTGPGPAIGATVWPDTTIPQIADSGPDDAVEVGVRFRSDTAGSISGIRFFKGVGNTGSHVAHLWSESGTLLATATFSGESAAGWQQVNFSAPVAISANTVYVASYHTSNGHYSVDENFFSGRGWDNAPLHALADLNGVYAYGPSGSFPSRSWNSANYWVDVVYSTEAGQVPPTVTGLEPAGWFAGDMHVHRSCGGSPEPIPNILDKMNSNNLAVISMLADMGNGEVQNASQDLPRVNGQDDPLSVSGRIMHWDAEWHWDPVYFQYPFQALGGHVVALGLAEGHQIEEEYTKPLFDWAHQQNGIAGFAHMQYLKNDIPQTLDCCTPLEYPVEVALGTTDFVSEDVDQVGSNQPMCPECAMQAYYRLLNCGFRPGLAAGTDYPCNAGAPLGSLLTYVRTADGQMSYRNWIDGIAKGRTVISRNGHNEFLDLKVNGSAMPGDEIQLTGGASLPVTVVWSANQPLSGTIELLHNGVVVASQVSSASSGNPALLTATVQFSRSGWLAARRMGSDGHQVHTAAVFVTVDNLPVRASSEDANFYVQWMDNLLAKTSTGGAWSSYFSSDRAAAQARYSAAREKYRQISSEAAAGTGNAAGTIFNGQLPSLFDNDAHYELGTRFWSDVAGQVTQVRIYTNAAEGGSHTVRIWRFGDGALLAGPFTWDIPSGTAGWKAFTLPAPLTVAASTDYIVSVSNSSDLYYAAQVQGFSAPVASGHLHTYIGSGVYATTSGSMPTSVWQNSSYFRDVVFVPQN